MRAVRGLDESLHLKSSATRKHWRQRKKGVFFPKAMLQILDFSEVSESMKAMTESLLVAKFLP